MAGMDNPLPRSISSADLSITDRCRQAVKRDWKQDGPVGATNFFASTPSFTLTLPALTGYPQDFKDFLFRRVIDYNIKQDLEESKALNWCREATELVPLSTIGDGNCLLHAASLGMWGFQDRNYTLRTAIHEAVANPWQTTLYKRWKLWRERELQQMGVVLEEGQWAQEWDLVKKHVSLQQTSYGLLEGTDQFHVFVLANVLRRPIVMYAMPKMTSYQTGGTLQQVEFHGIYLPLLWDQYYCKKDPLPLAFCNNHFSPLVVIDTTAQYKNGFLVLPLVDYFGNELPVRFLLGTEDIPSLKRAYLNLTELGNSYSSPYIHKNVLCAQLTVTETPSYLKPLLTGFVDKCFDAYHGQQKGGSASQGSSSTPPLPRALPQPAQPQKTDEERHLCLMGCGMYGDNMYGGYCSRCYRHASKEGEQKKLGQDPPHTHPVSAPLKCSICKINPGLPQFLGMCEHCYQAQQQVSGNAPRSHPHTTAHTKSAAPTPKPRTHYATSTQPKQGNATPDIRNCRTPRCDFFGPAETGYYCSKCFNERKAMGLQSSSGEQEMVVGNAAAPGRVLERGGGGGGSGDGGGGGGGGGEADPPSCSQCHKYFGSVEFGGLCTGCFMEKTKEETSPANKPNPLDHPPPSSRTSYAGTAGGGGGRETEPLANPAGRSHINSYPPPPPPSQPSPPPPQSHTYHHISHHPHLQAERHSYTADHTSRVEQRCFVCDLSIPIDNTPYSFVCPMHAKIVRTMVSSMQSLVGGGVSLSSEPPRSQPVTQPSYPARKASFDGGGHAQERPITPPPPHPPPSGWAEQDPRHMPPPPQLPPAAASYDPASSHSPYPPPSASGATGATGGGGAGGGEKQAKRLCRIPGCSFLAVPQLNYYCQDCYEAIK